MYCPQCSQPQVSDEMRFCSRCGFPLSGVRDLIASSGTLTASETPANTRLYRGFRGARQGTWIILAGLLLALFVGLLAAIEEDFAVLFLFPLLCVVVGFVRILYGLFVQGRAEKQKELPRVSAAIPAWGGPIGGNPELLTPGTTPVDAFMRPIRQTAEVVQPPSVTENTTRLLDEDGDSPRR